jgi:hypothetical protein
LGEKAGLRAKDLAVLVHSTSSIRVEEAAATLYYEAVSRLDEPYRATVLLRCFQDLSPTAIAAHTVRP